MTSGTISITARTLDLAREALGHDGENALQSLPCGVESDGPAGACNTKSGPNRNGSHEDRVMAFKALPSPEVLRQLLRYEPDTGKLFWLPRGPEWFCESRNRWGGVMSAEAHAKSWNSNYAGKEALTAASGAGRRHGNVLNRSHLAHRIAWAIAHNEWPSQTIDHINGDPTDNRLSNLRLATVGENMRNRKAQSNNRSGVKGVYWDESRQKWKVQVKVDGRVIFNKRYIDIEVARDAYAQASQILHGEFARWE